MSKVLVFGFAFLIWSKKGKEQSKQARTATATNDDLTLDPLSSPPLSSHSKVRRRPLLRRPALRHPHRRRRHRIPDPVLLGSLSRPGRRRRSGLSGAARPVLELDLTLPEKLQSGEGDRPRDERRGAEEERTADRERGAGPEQGPEATVRGERKTEEECGCC